MTFYSAEVRFKCDDCDLYVAVYRCGEQLRYANIDSLSAAIRDVFEKHGWFYAPTDIYDMHYCSKCRAARGI